MKNIGKYKIETFPISRISTTDIGIAGLKKHHIKALIELDVTEARKMIFEKKKLIDDRIEIREYLYITVLVDHDIIDGAPAVRALSKLTKLVESGFGLS